MAERKGFQDNVYTQRERLIFHEGRLEFRLFHRQYEHCTEIRDAGGPVLLVIRAYQWPMVKDFLDSVFGNSRYEGD